MPWLTETLVELALERNHPPKNKTNKLRMNKVGFFIWVYFKSIEWKEL